MAKRAHPESVMSDEQTGSYVDLYEHELSREEADELYGLLQQHLLPHMSQDRGRMYGKEWASKRLAGTVSTAPGIRYSYSSVTRTTMELTFAELPWLDAVRRRMEALCGHELNFVFLNFYRPSTAEHPDDNIGWHADDEAEMVPGSSIVSLSCGDTRWFAFRKKAKNSDGKQPMACQTALATGDVAIMRGEVQKHYQHSITTRGAKASTRGRWNLTFRRFRAAASLE